MRGNKMREEKRQTEQILSEKVELRNGKQNGWKIQRQLKKGDGTQNRK